MAVIGQEAGFPGCCTPGGAQEKRSKTSGRDLLAAVIREKARAAGAGDVEVTLEEKEHWATSRSGESIFMEKRLIARAVGSPRFARA